jgi:iron complex outermembrane recepter protein
MIDTILLAIIAPMITTQSEVERPNEIVVTGERVPRSTHDTASSVAIETEETIEAQAGPDRIEQLLQAIPNVQLGSGGEGPVIRGQDSTGVVRDLPAFLSGTRPRTTIRVDGRSATYYELAFGLTSVWDVGRVAVFRSPQTTTQGRNSIGGAIFVETNEPTFDWEGRVRLIAGDYSTRQAAGVVSGPLADDELAFRLSGDVRRSRTSSLITNAAGGVDPNRDDSEFIRLKLKASPNAMPDTGFSLAYSHGRSLMPQIEGVREPFEDRRDPIATYGIFAITVDSLTGRFVYQPSGGVEARATLSYGKARVRRHAPMGLGEAQIDAVDVSVEPIIAWRSANGLNLTGGMNYTRSTLDQSIDLTAFPMVRGTGVFADVQNSIGLFGEGSMPLSSTLTLTAGLRYQYDRQVRQGALTGNVLSLPLNYDRTFTAWLPKVSLAWDVSPDLRIGVLAQLASNPGGVNLNTARARTETFDAERLWAFELFGRARFAGGKLQVSANAFRYEMFDAQRTQTIYTFPPSGPPVSSAQVDNAPRAWSMGLEVELDWRPSPRFHLRSGIGLLNTRITRTLDPADLMLGKQFQRSPHFSGSASIVWTPAEPLTLSAQVRHTGGYFSDDLETTVRRIAPSTTVDARAAWIWGGATIFAYVRNLFDEFHLTYRFDPGTGLATAGDPREFGLGIEGRF